MKKHKNRRELFRSVDAAYREACGLLDRNYNAILEKLKSDFDGGQDPLLLSEWRKLVIRHAAGIGDEYITAFFREIDADRSITTAMRGQAGSELDRCGHMFLGQQKSVYKDMLFKAGFSGGDDLRMWMDDLAREVAGVMEKKRKELNNRIFEHNKQPGLRRQNQILWLLWSAAIVGALLVVGILWAVVFT